MFRKKHVMDSLLYYGMWQIEPKAIVNWQSGDSIGIYIRMYVDTRVED